ncbi:SPX domain-containing protein 2-like [Punica granatum]|uniref:SPX domain-containing protein n=2 Tax=Punica granatum TaxID=22663 RepID=A0A218WGY9_PUNGR|nr:SPX domain-containing protein 2-like [Punica granatum]OWM71749.1 hypothetical protein CDL15_Pgr005937 [Punica granatum]PKI75752.1 hypothetical protein CRG98_003895 [Punica granatum]
MKFGKSLSNQIEETLPEWRDKFLSYKDLKKKLKSIDPRAAAERPAKRPRSDPDRADAGNRDGITEEEIQFIRLLEDEMEKFNSFFVEKEEEYIIRMKILQDGIAKAKDSNEEMLKIKKEIVDFHGEMVLLENYSALNYTGLVKILKKYDKRTGALIRLPFIQRVLQQPFFTTDLLYKLVKGCEVLLDGLFPKHEPKEDPSFLDQTKADCPHNVEDEGSQPSTSTTTTTTTSSSSSKDSSVPLRAPNELAEIEHMESLYMKSTISALRALKEIRSGSSTVSVFSLPPLHTSGLEETWKKIPILEQAAK